MIKNINLKTILSRLFFKGEKYIVIEMVNHYVQITFLKFDPKQKEIAFLKNFLLPAPEFTLPNAVGALRSLLKKIGKLNKYQIVVSLDSSLATTIYSSVSLVRPHPKETIDEADLDNLISQAIWRFFDKQRWKVAQKMGAADVDVILSDVRIRDIRIDGHRVVNPIGFKAKAVEIAFSQTFLIRDLLRELRELLPKEQVVLITESGTALSHVLSEALQSRNFYLANLFPNETALFAADKGKLAHHDNFEWGGNDLNHLLYRHFRVDSAVAGSLVENYAQNSGSPAFLRKLENIFVKELHTFANGIESLVDAENSDVYLNTFFTLPQVVYSPRFHSRFQKSIKIAPLSTLFITEKLGYALKFNTSARPKNEVSLLGAMLEAVLLPKNDAVSHLANRRVRWLVN